MRILLDTHAFLWLVTDNPKLSNRARSTFLEAENELMISAVTGFEIAVKYALGKLELSEPPRDFMEKRIRNNALTHLPISMSHTYRLSHLAPHHRDPFDRLLISQALEEDIPILSADSIFPRYNIDVIW
ncbi:Death on curing protein, Doc toxin [hydrothermal vent metagenome]|uniref:Death on curing protein, Doc toxin n=1 Tax=hydrothermal vent metagenome TaxID=652676 RepID=A0A3B1C4I0_9ZZZZ